MYMDLERSMRTNGRIVWDPENCDGKPMIQGTSVRTSEIWNLLKKGKTFEEILKSFPVITHDDLQEIIAYENGVEARKIKIVTFACPVSLLWSFGVLLIIAAARGMRVLGYDADIMWFQGVALLLIGCLFLYYLVKAMRKEPERRPLLVFGLKVCDQCGMEFDDWPGFGLFERQSAKYCKTCREQMWNSSNKMWAILSPTSSIRNYPNTS